MDDTISFEWTQWQGNNQFYCKGCSLKCITGPKEGNIAVYSVHGALLFGCALYTLFELPFYYTTFSPFLGLFPFPFIGLVFYCLVKTQFTDPGILLPKGRSPFSPQPPDPNLGQSIDDSLDLYKYRWCNTCYIWKPPLASHCRYCNNCVKDFDHHCIFVNNCIGVRNRKFFVGFLISTSGISIYGFIISTFYLLWNILYNPLSYSKACDNVYLLIVSGILIPLGLMLMYYGRLRSLLHIIPVALGVVILAAYVWLAIGFEGLHRNPVPFFIAVICAVYGPWVIGMGVIYMKYIFTGVTKKQQVAIARKNKGEMEREWVWARIWKFLLEKVPESELNVKRKPIEMKEMVVG